MSVFFWVRLKSLSSLYCSFNLFRRHRIFLDDSMGKNCCDVALKKVKNSLVDPPQANSQFVNLIPQKVCLGAMKFMPQFT